MKVGVLVTPRCKNLRKTANPKSIVQKRTQQKLGTFLQNPSLGLNKVSNFMILGLQVGIENVFGINLFSSFFDAK